VAWKGYVTVVGCTFLLLLYVLAEIYTMLIDVILVVLCRPIAELSAALYTAKSKEQEHSVRTFTSI